MGISKSQRRRERNPKWVIYRAGANAELGIPGVPVAHRVDLINPRNTACSLRPRGVTPPEASAVPPDGIFQCKACEESWPKRIEVFRKNKRTRAKLKPKDPKTKDKELELAAKNTRRTQRGTSVRATSAGLPGQGKKR